ncbi:MAG: Flp pilus assembly protein CpaB [Myxococcota bacterium]
MRTRAIVALTLAAGAAASIYLYLRGVERAKRGGVPVAIVVARESLAQGARLGSDNGAVREVPSTYVHPEAIGAGEVRDFIGRPLQNAIAAGQPILETDFALRSTATDRPLSAAVPKGMRALTIRVDASSSVGGLLRPGDHVDVLGTFAREGRGERTTLTLLQNVTVLATGTRTEAPAAASEAGAAAGGRAARAGGSTFSHITIAVDLEEAELLAFGSTRGDLHVVLRHDEDVQIVENVPEKSLADLFEVEKRAQLMSRHRTIEALRAVRR